MLAYYPYDFTEQKQCMTKEELFRFCEQLRSVLNGDKELIRLELSWDKGTMGLRALTKTIEPPAPELPAQEELCHVETVDSSPPTR
jgi:hypothetical protein